MVKNIELFKNDNGTARRIVFNVHKIFDEDEMYKDKIIFDPIFNDYFIRTDIPVLSKDKIHLINPYITEWSLLTENLVDDIYADIDKRYNFCNKSLIANNIRKVIQIKKSILLEFFKKTKWDKVPRLETVFIDYLGTPDTPLNREMSKIWMTAAMSRLNIEEVMFQYGLMLLGGDDDEKSRLLNKLTLGTFMKSINTYNLYNIKRMFKLMRGAFIALYGDHRKYGDLERKDLWEVNKGLKSRGYSAKRKRWLTSETVKYNHHYVPVYFDEDLKILQKFKFMYEMDFYRTDWPLECNPSNATKKIGDMDDDFTKWTGDLTFNEVLQIWAEAMYYAEENINLYLNYEMEQELKKVKNRDFLKE